MTGRVVDRHGHHSGGAGGAPGPGAPRRGTTAWRSLTTGARLGWAIESNWTDPVLFAVYSVARPVGAALVLVAIVWIVAGGGRPDYVGFLVVGSACWTFVGGGMSGFVWAVLDDRERYRMLKYVVLSAVRFLPFLVGRASAQLVTASAGFLVTLAVGVFFLGVRIDVGAIDWPLLVASMTVGLGSIVALGLAVAGLCLTIRREAWNYPEAIAGGLYLLSGAIFPPDVLPAMLQPFALALPMTWWLEGVRRALLGVSTPGILAGFPDGAVLLALCASAAVLTLGSGAVFRTFERAARERGLIDQTTGS
ncbi:MAG: ABC transporter permease [Chloroflexota bacterium]